MLYGDKVAGCSKPFRLSIFVAQRGVESRRVLVDGKPVSFISAFFEDYADIGATTPLSENDDRMFQGSTFLAMVSF